MLLAISQCMYAGKRVGGGLLTERYWHFHSTPPTPSPSHRDQQTTSVQLQSAGAHRQLRSTKLSQAK